MCGHSCDFIFSPLVLTENCNYWWLLPYFSRCLLVLKSCAPLFIQIAFIADITYHCKCESLSSHTTITVRSSYQSIFTVDDSLKSHLISSLLRIYKCQFTGDLVLQLVSQHGRILASLTADAIDTSISKWQTWLLLVCHVSCLLLRLLVSIWLLANFWRGTTHWRYRRCASIKKLY